MSDEAQRVEEEAARYRYLLASPEWWDYELVYAVSGMWWDDPCSEDNPGINGYPGKPLGEAIYGHTGADLLEVAVADAVGRYKKSSDDPDGLPSLREKGGRYRLDRGEALRFVLKHIDRINAEVALRAEGRPLMSNGTRLVSAEDRPLVIPEILKPLADEQAERPPLADERVTRPPLVYGQPNRLADLGAADWADIELVVPIEGEAGLTVRRKGARGLPRRVVWGDFGLGRCKKLQEDLRALATRKGTCPRPGGREGEAFSQRVAKLRRTLRKAFGLASDPFEPPERDGMLRARFTIATPPDPDVTPARDVDDEIGDMFRAHVPERRF